MDIFNDPIISKRRSGKSDDPYLNISESLQIVKGKVVLSEIPNRFQKVKVSGSNKTWFESVNESKDNIFRVDYTEGVVFFDSVHNGKTLTFAYLGEGGHFFPAERIYVEGEELSDILTVHDKFSQVDTAILEQKHRVDEQIRSVPQPSEIVDMRIDKNGKIFPVAKDRIDAEQIKIEESYRDKNGKVYPSLKDRIIGEQTKIEDAYRGANGKAYDSLKSRFDSIDTLTASHTRRLVNSVTGLKAGDYENGEYVLTLGYYALNDGGHGLYYIDNNSTNSDVQLDNGLHAHLIIGDSLNPKQFGAKGNGINDDAPAFKLALNKIKNIGGGTLVVSHGKYVLKSSLVAYKNTAIICDTGVELIRDHTGYLLMNGDAGANYSAYKGNGNIYIQGGVWDGKGGTFTTASTIITLGHGDNITIKDVVIKDVVNNHGIEINASRNVLVDNCKFIGFRNTTDRDYAEAIQIDKATLFGFPAFGSYDNTACENVTIRNCYFGKSDTVGMTGWGRAIGTHSADQAVGAKHRGINIINNHVEDTIQWAFYVSHWDDSVVTGNKIFNCGGGIRVAVANQSMYRINVNSNLIVSSGHYGLAGISMVGTDTYELRSIDCSNNIVYDVSSESGSGIYAAYCNGCKIDGNTVRNVLTHGIIVRYGRYYTVANNSIVSCSENGIFVWTNVLYSNITNNDIGYIGKNGIHINNNVDTLAVASNSISGVNGAKTNDCNHIRVTEQVDRISLANNVCRDINFDYIATKALYITNTCTNVSRTGNIFAGIAGGVSDGSGSLVTGDLL